MSPTVYGREGTSYWYRYSQLYQDLVPLLRVTHHLCPSTLTRNPQDQLELVGATHKAPWPQGRGTVIMWWHAWFNKQYFGNELLAFN
jgi:hypothetical protein